MSKTKIDIRKYWGYKLFKLYDDDSIELIRIIKINEFNNSVTILNEETKSTKKVNFDTLSEYTPLEPFAVAGFSIVECNTGNGDKIKDVLISLYKMIDIKMGINEPYCLCRQSVTDFFYNIIANTEDHGYVGVSVTRDDCPTNIPYEQIAFADDLCLFEMVHLYRDDTMEDILNLISIEEYDKVLDNLFKLHCDSLGPTGYPIYTMKTTHKGWCKNLRTLLRENNFIVDFNSMCGITAFDCNLMDFVESVDVENEISFTLNREFMDVFDEIFKVNTSDNTIIKYWYDVDLADFNNTNYTLLKDYTNTLYIVVYTIEGEYLEKDLQDQSNQMDVSTRIRLSYYNKYGQNEK